MMDPAALRIIDANLNRAREGLRVLEEYARFVLDDAGLSLRAKQARHALAEIADAFGPDAALSARDIRGDVGAALTTPAEGMRGCAADVARAAARRTAEALRCIEEYGKLLSVVAGQCKTEALRYRSARSVSAQVEGLRYETYALEQDVFVGGPRRMGLRRARLHVIVTEALCRGPWEDVCERALRGGADVIQVREKALCDRDLLDRARLLRAQTRRHGALLIINDRPDIAVLADADGVHLGSEDLAPDEARRIVGPHRLVGATAHAVGEAVAVFERGADYIGVGPMFASLTKPDVSVGGPSLLTEIAAALATAGALPDRDPAAAGTPSHVPLVAIGGIIAENVALLRGPPHAAPVQVAVCQSIISADDVEAAARGIKSQLAPPNAPS